jgi:hypothetical protein
MLPGNGDDRRLPEGDAPQDRARMRRSGGPGMSSALAHRDFLPARQAGLQDRGRARAHSSA